MSNQIPRPVRLAACLVAITTLVAGCGAARGPNQAGAADADAGAVSGVTVPTWPVPADTPSWSLQPDGSAVPTDLPTTTPPAALGGGAGGSPNGSSGSTATDPQVEQLLQQADQALDAANAASSDDASQSGQDEGVLP